VRAWDLIQHPAPEVLDLARYRILVLRAVHTVLQPFGVSEQMLEDWLMSKAGYLAPVGVVPKGDTRSPLFTNVTEVRDHQCFSHSEH
jgi:hypothetical protein